MMEWLFLLIGAAISGFAVAVYFKRHKEKPVGDLRVDKSDPYDSPYLFLELNVDPSIIEQKEYITLKVKVEDFISQK